jgi:tRNA(adenine34) deaminase
MMAYERFMKIALDHAKAALLNNEFPVGCVITHEDDLLITSTRKGTKGIDANEVDHAEMLALREFSHMTKKIDLQKTTIFTTLEPCLMCFSAILLSGIETIVFAYEDIMGGGTSCDLTKLTPLYKECKISIVPGVLRRESVSLFKTFFENSNNAYLKDSLLARHTLKLM